jgi:membrane protease YdiL (CAAX protease family)
LLLTLGIVLARGKNLNDLGLGSRGFVPSLWILPAAVALAAVSIFIAAEIGALHPLYKGDLKHISGYVLWTIYQQFLLQDYFMDRLLRLTSNEARAITLAGTLFALAHLPNLVLTAATLVWGIASCVLFRRYRNIWALGLAQGLLGLVFAICVPDALHHHLRVGLGYLRYGTPPAP